MTDDERYREVLKELGEVLQSKNQQISFLQYEVKHLKEQLNEQNERAENEQRS